MTVALLSTNVEVFKYCKLDNFNLFVINLKCGGTLEVNDVH